MQDSSVEISKAIGSLPRDDPTKCEGQIRQLHLKVQALNEAKEKGKLLSELQSVASCGLSKDLKDRMEKKGLAAEFGLVLVLQYKTTLPELAKYLYLNKDADGETGLEIVRERIGQEIEVLGGLKAKGVDVEKKWVENLCQAAPSLRSLLLLSLTERNNLCQKASRGEMAAVSELISVAKAAKQTELPPKLADKNSETKSVDEKKAVDEEKLKRAKELMDEAKSMAKTQASENKTELNNKLVAVLKALEMPPEWCQQDVVASGVLMKELDGIIQKHSKIVESATESNSSDDVGLVTKASGGRALCGIYHSDYESPTPAGQPILLAPTNVKMFKPSQSIQERYMRFTAQGASAKFVSTMASSSSNAGVAVKGFGGLFVGEIEGAHGFQDEHTSKRTVKSSTSSVSVLQYTSITKKEFQIEEDKMNLTVRARETAMTIEKSENSSDREAARSFMKCYGSHVPTGVHKLGGIFYSIADAESHSSIETSKFTKAAVDRLQTQISAGYLGGGFVVGGSGTAEHSSSSGKAEASKTKEDSATYRFSVEVIGPLVSNPETFKQLLVYNSTWAIIGRGPPEGYIPVWQLLLREGSEFKPAADILQQIWEKDEDEKKKKWEERNKMEKAREELIKRKKEFLDRSFQTGKSYRPVNGVLVNEKDWMKEADAYDQAIEHIMEDPEYNICKIVYWWHIAGGGYSLMCWRAPRDDTPMTFEKIKGGHVLFFSEVCFKWKDYVPKRG